LRGRRRRPGQSLSSRQRLLRFDRNDTHELRYDEALSFRSIGIPAATDTVTLSFINKKSRAYHGATFADNQQFS